MTVQQRAVLYKCITNKFHTARLFDIKQILKDC